MIRSYLKPGYLLAGLVVLLDVLAIVKGTDGDAYGTLLVADSILRYGSVSLEHYSTDTLDLYGTRIRLTNGLPFYYFPLGTAFISLPFVAIADVLGFNVTVHDAILQRSIAALSSVLTLLLMMRVARQFRDDDANWIVPAVFFFGTALASTMGLALESHNFAIVFALIGIDSVIRTDRQSGSPCWWLVGVSVFLAYLIRPTFSIFGFYLLCWLFRASRPAALKAGFLVLVLLFLFVVLSLKTYGQVLPDYYLPKRLSAGDPTIALIGNLFSPARGLLVFSSFIGLVWLFPRQSGGRWARGWPFVAVLWPLTHLYVISRFPHWWGGHSYGPRLMIDCLPGLLLLTLVAWPTQTLLKTTPFRSFLLLISVVFSLFANTVQGMFNPYTAHWSNAPDIDDYPEYLFDWRYPLFFANERGHQKRADEFKAKFHRNAWPRVPRDLETP